MNLNKMLEGSLRALDLIFIVIVLLFSWKIKKTVKLFEKIAKRIERDEEVFERMEKRFERDLEALKSNLSKLSWVIKRLHKETMALRRSLE